MKTTDCWQSGWLELNWWVRNMLVWLTDEEGRFIFQKWLQKHNSEVWNVERYIYKVSSSSICQEVWVCTMYELKGREIGAIWLKLWRLCHLASYFKSSSRVKRQIKKSLSSIEFFWPRSCKNISPQVQEGPTVVKRPGAMDAKHAAQHRWF